MQFTALNTLAFSEVPAAKMAGANTLSNMAQQLAIGLGIAIGALALRIAEWFHPYRAGMIPLENFQIAFVVIGVVALLSVVDTLALSRDAGDEVRKKPVRRGKAK
ncbi:putative membrane transport protein [Yersinia frederiksenii]|nr:putative membrane transport protein [Yersinia frederiksenii]